MRDLIFEVAKQLGWLPMDYGLAVQCGSGPGPEIVWPDNPILFAAYAKAEIEKRGMFANVGMICPYNGKPMVLIGGKDINDVRHNYDPTSPVDEARAVLSAIAEALCL